ncbi:hypothetical protein I4U23_011372 [Adineta vaga]|nr:hypothetical protein I4U23_011372 [Adineta vaga]
MPSNDLNAKQDLVEFLKQRYRNNNKQMKLIEKFERKYKSDDALRWYTSEPFLYRHLNKALRTEDIDQLYTFRFFISDLCKNLLREFKIVKEYEPRVTLYRGTRIPFDEYQKLKENEGHLISMNGFLSTSLSKEVALRFADTSDEINQAVLFEIECDLSEVQTIVLAQIVEFSTIKSEEEVLIDIGAVFLIISVESQENIALIKMKATDDGAKISQNYLEINQAELKEKDVRIIWGDLLLNMGYNEKALQYFEKLQDMEEGIEDWQVQIHIGHVLSNKGSFDEAATRYFYANELWEKQQLTQNISILSHISSVLIEKGLFDQALEIISEILQIYENSSEIEHNKIYYHDIAAFLSSMGRCYFWKGEYDLSITYFNRAYDTRETHYSCDHFESAKDLDQLAILYRTQGDYQRALHYFSHATSIYERTFPSNHDRVIEQLVHIGQTLGECNKKQDALKYLRKALALHETIISDDRTNIAFNLDLLAQISLLNGDEENTIDLIQRALEVKRTYLTEDHPYIADNLTSLGNIFKERGQYDNACETYVQALNIYEKINPNGHPESAVVLHGIGYVNQENGDYETALLYYRKAEIIYRKYMSPKNPNFIRLLLCFAEIRQLKGELHMAIKSLKDSLTTIQKSDPINISLLQKTHMMLADTYMLQGDVFEALYAYEKGFAIEIGDEIEHYVYHVGYRLLMLSCTLESRGKFLKAQNMQKNASIIFQKYDYHHLFNLTERLYELCDNDHQNNTGSFIVQDLYTKAFVTTPAVSEILHKKNELYLYSHEERDAITFYYKMYLYQQLFIDKKQRASATTLLACIYEKQYQYELARYYHEKARNLYIQLMTDTNVDSDINESISLTNEINSHILHLTVHLASRTFPFLYRV